MFFYFLKFYGVVRREEEKEERGERSVQGIAH
jgi:hypothetical protein